MQNHEFFNFLINQLAPLKADKFIDAGYIDIKRFRKELEELSSAETNELRLKLNSTLYYQHNSYNSFNELFSDLGMNNSHVSQKINEIKELTDAQKLDFENIKEYPNDLLQMFTEARSKVFSSLLGKLTSEEKASIKEIATKHGLQGDEIVAKLEECIKSRTNTLLEQGQHLSYVWSRPMLDRSLSIQHKANDMSILGFYLALAFPN